MVYLGQRQCASWRGATIQLIFGIVILTFLAITRWSSFGLIVWGVATAFFGTAAALTAGRAYGKTPFLLVDHHGFLIGLPLTVNRYLLPWSEIEAIYPANCGGSSRYNCKPCLSLRLCDLQRFRASLNPLQKLFVSKKPRQTGTPINLPQGFFDIPIEELLSQIAERFANELSRCEIRLSREP